MELEHCEKTGHDQVFETTNYKIETTPQREYEIVTGKEAPKESEMKNGRRIPDLKELEKLPASIDAGLTPVEILMLVLYTGPMVVPSLLCSLYILILYSATFHS